MTYKDECPVCKAEVEEGSRNEHASFISVHFLCECNTEWEWGFERIVGRDVLITGSKETTHETH